MFFRNRVLAAIFIILLTFSGCGGGGGGSDRAGTVIDTDNDGIRDTVDTDDDNDGISDADEVVLGTNPLKGNPDGADVDGDGVPDANESDADSTTATAALKDPCLPKQNAGYRGYDNQNSTWIAADCDNDTYKNGYEDIFSLTPNNYISDPYDIASKPLDTDSDGTPNAVDTDDDGDGYSDSDENASRAAGEGGDPLDRNEIPNDFDDDNISNYTDPDDDNDGVSDVNEITYGSNPKDTDSDDDGILDGVENANKNGVKESTETNASNDDTDGDGLKDGVEDANKDGILDAKTDTNGTDKWIETDPLKADSDEDGLNDKLESDTNTNPRNKDTDGDGVEDGVEDANKDGSLDANTNTNAPNKWTETDPRLADTDGDTLSDQIERTNGTNPRKKDTDGDGVEDNSDAFPIDATETVDTDGDGRGNNADTDDDNDGINDADELDGTGKTATDPLDASSPSGNPDYDGDGVSDKEESDENASVVTPALKDPCLKQQAAGYTGYDRNNAIWKAADCDSDGVRNEYEDNASSDPYDASDKPIDTDGDGLPNAIDPDDDNDDLNDTVEDKNGNGVVDDGETNPLLYDTDGDGLKDTEDAPLYPCPFPKGTDIPEANVTTWKSYTDYNASNSIWQKEDCDNDGDPNGKEHNVSLPQEDRLQSNPYDKNSFDSNSIGNGNCTYFKGKEYCADFEESNTTLWLDRNLGANRPCQSRTDTECYGDLYQWGRGADGHEIRSAVTTGSEATALPHSGNTFIIAENDWLDGSVDGNGSKRQISWENNTGDANFIEEHAICPPGWRVALSSEVSDLIGNNNIQNREDAYTKSGIRLPSSGQREKDGEFEGIGETCYLWSSKPKSTDKAEGYSFGDGTVTSILFASRAFAFSVRCVKK